MNKVVNSLPVGERVLVVFLMFALFSSSTLADPPNLVDQYIYKRTFAACQGRFSLKTMIASKDLATVFSTSGFDSVVTFKPNETLITHGLITRQWLNSTAFERALNDCYGNEEWKKTIAKVTLRGQDVMGHIYGFAATIAALITIHKIHGGINASKWAVAHPRFMKYFNGGLLTLSLASLAGQAASLGLKYLNHRELEKALLDYQDDPEAIAQEKALYKALVDTSYEEVENRLKEVNLELQGNPADQNRKSYLLDKKTELEALLRERDQKKTPTTP